MSPATGSATVVQVSRTRTLFKSLTRRGPRQGAARRPGVRRHPRVALHPAEGFHLPGVAFGHDWLTDAYRYTGTLEHLASWGIVAAAPATQRGPVPRSSTWPTTCPPPWT